MKEKEKQTINKKLIIAGMCIIILLLCVIIFLLVSLNKQKSVDVEDGSVYVIDENNYQQIMEDMDAEVKDGYFETYMNTEWTFSDGTSETKDAILGNSPNNTKPIRCEVVLNDTGETVFSTGVLPVGAQLPPFKLDVDLDAGTYDALCKIYLLDEVGDGTYKDYSNAGFHVTITVEN